MFYPQLQSYLKKSDFFQQYSRILEDRTPQISFYPMNLSARALLVAHAFQKTQQSVIVITNDDKMAEEMWDDLELLLGEQNVCLMPDYEVLPYEERSPHITLRAQRLQSLYRAVSGKPAVYCISLHGLIRKILPKHLMQDNILNLKLDVEYDLSDIITQLVNMGYEHQYQVSKVGEFSHRGGILDIFSPHYDTPYRIEFFGDEIITIRPFSIYNQRSEIQEITNLVITPSREICIHNIPTNHPLRDIVLTKGFYEGVELDIPTIFEDAACFVDYFDPLQTIVFWDNPVYHTQVLEEMYEDTREMWIKEKKNNPKRDLLDPEKLFVQQKKIDEIRVLYLNYYISASESYLPFAAQTLETPINACPDFNNDLSTLEASIQKLRKQDYQIFVQSENKGQSKRMQELLSKQADDLHFSIGVLHHGFILEDCKIVILTDHEIFGRTKRKRYQEKFTKVESITDYENLRPGDYIVHIDYGIGIYEGLHKIEIDGNLVECLTIQYEGKDKIYVPTYQLRLVSRYVSEEGVIPAIHKLGSKQWEMTKSRARSQIELFMDDIVKLYAERSVRKGIAMQQDNPWQKELEESFIYEDTPDQARSTNEIKEDMESEEVMERLLCGDVGFGKTEVAIRAAFKAVMSGYQVAILAPTTLLAEQHYHVFKERMAQFPMKLALFCRFRSAANIKKDLVRLAEGEIDIAIGTHRLLSNDVLFKKVGLLVIDEEHRFGVLHKEKIRKLKTNIDTLFMSATPIPRTLNMVLCKLKKISLIQTSPKARLPIRTMIVPFNKEIIKEAIQRELDRGGQVYFLHNQVKTIQMIADDLRELMPQVRFRVGHGQLPEKELETILEDFANQEFDVLIASTIIESGLDITNANTILINRADMFGLAQLYQIRGRVGRGNRRAYAYFIVPKKISEEAKKRLETLTEYNALGSGYQIAMRDLEIRGAGTLLGAKQSGIIHSIGFNFYNRLLEQAVHNFETKNPEGLWAEDEQSKIQSIRIDSDYYFPSDYIQDEKEKLHIYKRMNEFKSLGEFAELTNELRDRFGEVPQLALNAIEYYRLRYIATSIGLKTFQILQKTVIIEFFANRMPSREKISKLLQQFNYPVKFDTTESLKITYDLSAKANLGKAEVLTEGLSMLDSMKDW